MKAIRELGQEAGNKTCFDCHQRGPTYVNCTIGAFVCTGCSGILRGLNPPHRVKSISMASFSGEEVESLRQRGNLFCRKVWLGLYEGSREAGANRDEQQMKDFLALKYEKRRWYVDPSEVARQESLKETSSTNLAQTKASQPQPPPPTQQSSASHQAPPASAARPHPHAHAQGHKGPPTSLPLPQPANSTAEAQAPSAAPSLDLFSADPFGSPVAAKPPPVPVAMESQAQAAFPPPSQGRNGNGGFADFESNFGAMSLSPPPQTQPVPPSIPPPAAFGAPLLPTDPTLPLTKSATMPPTQPQQAGVPSLGGGGDKYSALKELDSLFGSDVTVPGPDSSSSGVSSFSSSFSTAPAPPQPRPPHSQGPSNLPPPMPKSLSASFGAPHPNGAGPFSPPPPQPPPPLTGNASANPFAQSPSPFPTQAGPVNWGLSAGAPVAAFPSHSQQAGPAAGVPPPNPFLASAPLPTQANPANVNEPKPSNWNPFL